MKMQQTSDYHSCRFPPQIPSMAMSKRLQVGEGDNTISTAYVRMQAPQMPSPVPGQSGPVPAPKHFRMVPSWLYCGKWWWCGRGDLNPHDRLGSADFHTTSAFAAPPTAASWSGLSLHHSPYEVRCCPSSLYTFPEVIPGLARDCHSRFPRL